MRVGVKIALKVIAGVLVTLSLLVYMSSGVIHCDLSPPKETRAARDLVTIELVLNLYRLDNGFYPSTEQGLRALVSAPATDPKPANYQKGGYIKEMPIDPWGVEYKYALGKDGAVIWTLGGSESETKLLKEIIWSPEFKR